MKLKRVKVQWLERHYDIAEVEVMDDGTIVNSLLASTLEALWMKTQVARRPVVLESIKFTMEDGDE